MNAVMILDAVRGQYVRMRDVTILILPNISEVLIIVHKA